jgi:protein O-GlcNAc transferase
MRTEEMHLKSLKLEEELGRKDGIAITYGNLGGMYLETADKVHMCRCWRKARDLWREIGRPDEVAEFNSLLRLHGCNDR